MTSRGRVLLINPWIYDFAAYNHWCEPLGLLSLGAVLLKAGFRVSMIDCLSGCVPRQRPDGSGPFLKTVLPKPALLRHVPRHYGRYGISLEDFLGRLSGESRPDAVLVTSSMTYWYPGVVSSIRWVRKFWPEVPVVLGGTYASLCPQHACCHSGADRVVEGEAEGSILEVLGEAVESRDRAGERAGWVRADRARVPDLTFLPMPAHELRWQGGQPASYIGLETSRGCPFSCTYCASRELHAPFRQRAPDAVVEEIERYRTEFDIRHFTFFDDALLFQPETHFVPILERILERGLDGSFHASNGLHARFIDPPLAKLMFRAGFQTVRLGLESVDPVRQKESGGKVNNAEFESAVGSLKEAGFASAQVGAYLLTGLPGQTVPDILEAVRFVHRLGVQAYITEFSPIPSTGDARKLFGTRGSFREDDPLLQNNSIYPAMDRPRPWEEMDRVKQWVREENARVLQRSGM